MTYTLIAYRPEGGGGRCRDPWGSDFIHETGLTRDRLVQRVAELKADPGPGDFDQIIWLEEAYSDFADHDPNYDYAVETEAEALVPALRQAHKEKADAAKKAEAESLERATRQAKRRQYEQLRKEFEVPE